MGDNGRHQDRARLDGRGPGPRRRTVGRPDRAGGRELPDLRPARAGAGVIHALARLKAAPPTSTPSWVWSTTRRPRRSPRCAAGRARPARRPVPDRRVPDRLRHAHQHERQRGRGPHRAPSTRAATSTPTTTSTPARAATTRSPPPSGSRQRSVPSMTSPQPFDTWQQRCSARRPSSPTSSRPGAPTSWTPSRSPSARSSAATAAGRAGAGAGAPRLRGTRELPLGGTAAGTGLNAPAGLRRRGDPDAGGADRRAVPGGRDHFEAQSRAGRARRAVRRSTRSSRSASPRSATTCAGWAPVRGPGSPRSTCPTSSRARASCPAR